MNRINVIGNEQSAFSATLIPLEEQTSPTELTPTSSQSNRLDDSLQRYIQQVILVPKPMRTSKFFGQSVATLMGSIGGTPYIQASMNAGNNIPIPNIGYFFAACTVIGYGTGAIWCLNSNFIRLYPKDYAEKILLKDKLSHSYSAHIISNLLSIIIIIVPGYTAYKFNSIEWFSYLAAGIAAFISYNFSVFGFYTLIDVMHPSNIKKYLSKIDSLRRGNQSRYQSMPNSIAKFANTVHLAKIAITQSSPDEIELLFNQFFNARITPADFKDRLDELARSVRLKDYSRKLNCIELFSILIPISSTIVNSYLAFDAAKLVVDNNYFATFLIILTAIPYFFLNTYLVIGGIKQISDAILSKHAGNPSSAVIAKHFPYLNAFVNLLAFSLALLSSAQTGYITMSTVTPPLNWVLTVIILTSSIIFESHILAFIIKIATEHLIGKYSTNPFYGKILLIQNQLDKLKMALELVSTNYVEDLSEISDLAIDESNATMLSLRDDQEAIASNEDTAEASFSSYSLHR